MMRIFFLLPTVFLSWCACIVSGIQRPVYIKNILIRLFIRLYNVDISAVEKEPAEYSSFREFFVRKLRPDARSLQGDEYTLVSPADGRIVVCGTVDSDTCFNVKGSRYSAEDLTGSRNDAVRFQGGAFAVIHLRPFDYHRVHMPCAGTVTGCGFFRGRLFPVNEKGLRTFRNIYVRNRRRITLCSGECGTFALVTVGAFNVGRIPVEYSIPETGCGYFPVLSGQEFGKGEEIARFEIGSTVVLLFEKGRVELDNLEPDREIRMGERIGRIAGKDGDPG